MSLVSIESPRNLSPSPAPSARVGPRSTVFLDGLRGLAAFYVVLHHAFWLLQEGYTAGYLAHPASYTTLQYYVALFSAVLFRFGHVAVLFFFVLSGFVIHLRYARRIVNEPARADFGWGDFVYRRARRLYPPLLAALAITYALDHLGASLAFAIYQSKTPYPLINSSVACNYGWRTFFGNLAFLQKTYVPCWGSDRPLWSLKYEWWFYMIYPCLWPILRRSFSAASGAIVFFYFGSVVLGKYAHSIPGAALLTDVGSAMIIWWLGALLAEMYCGRVKIRFNHVAYLAPLLPILIVVSLKIATPEISWGLAFTGVIAAGFAMQESGLRLRLLERLKPLGETSYTLYVIHMPIIVLISGWLMSRSANHQLPRGVLWPLAASALVLIVAYPIHLIVEKPFTRKHP